MKCYCRSKKVMQSGNVKADHVNSIMDKEKCSKLLLKIIENSNLNLSRVIHVKVLQKTQSTPLHCGIYAQNFLENKAMEEEKYSRFLQKCAQISNSNLGAAIHAQVVKKTQLDSTFLRNHLLNMYAKCGELINTLQLFEEMPERNVVSWSAIIAGFVQQGHPKEALCLFQKMLGTGTKPNEFTFVSALNACSLSDLSPLADQIYAQVVRVGLDSNVFLTNALITALIRHKKLAEAKELFEKSPTRDMVTWNAMIAGYLQFSYGEIWSFWCRINREGLKPDEFTFASVLTGLAALSSIHNGLQVHSQLVKSGYASDLCVGNSLVDMYLKCKNLVDAWKVFDEMPQRDVVSWTQMASGSLQCGEPTKALEVIEQMKLMGVKPNKFTLATALNACASLVSLDNGKKAHGIKVKLGADTDLCVENALIDMYAKCGCMDNAWWVFQSIDDRSVVSWTTMIMGFAQNSFVREALELFDKMISEGVEPNHITFICVLYACSQGGLVDEGWGYFSSMARDHGVVPREDHYACMVDLLGKAGRILEAEALILSMPDQPGLLVWQTLLGACCIHGVLETAKRAAERALALDERDPSTYVLLSNTYAGLRNWDDVNKVRGLMEKREVKKMPGCSWIEGMGIISSTTYKHT